MSWSIRLGRFLGIDVYVHLTFLLLLAYIVVANYMQTQSWRIALQELLFVSLAFATVVMHEYGHALAARRYGIATHDITLLPIGGLARLERIPENPFQELVIAVAGPAVNVVLAAILLPLVVLSGDWSIEQLNPENALSTGGVFLRLLLINVMLVVFNAIPAFPMDGGRVLRAVLAMNMDYVRATRIAATVGQGLALVFGFVGLFGPWHMLLFIALFVWIGAAQEANAVATRSSLDGVPVRTAMILQFDAVRPSDTLADVARLVLRGFQQDFPVVDHDQVVGMLSRQDLMEALAANGHDGLAGAAMQHDFETAAPNELLVDVIPRLQASKINSLPVLENGKLLGLLTTENISELLMIRSAIQRSVHA